MIKTRPVLGIVPVVDTPLTSEEEIDVPALRRLIEFLNSKRIGGLWVLGTGSEDMNLSFDKWPRRPAKRMVAKHLLSWAPAFLHLRIFLTLLRKQKNWNLMPIM